MFVFEFMFMFIVHVDGIARAVMKISFHFLLGLYYFTCRRLLKRDKVKKGKRKKGKKEKLVIIKISDWMSSALSVLLYLRPFMSKVSITSE